MFGVGVPVQTYNREYNLTYNTTHKKNFQFAGIFRVSILLLPKFGRANSITASIQHMAGRTKYSCWSNATKSKVISSFHLNFIGHVNLLMKIEIFKRI